MKAYIIFIASIAFLTSCKLDNIAPVTTTTGTPASNSTMDISQLPIAPMFNSKGSNDQVVKLSVMGDTLKYLYTEHVDLLADSAKYNSSWYVYFKENFANTALANMDFTTLLSWGVTSTNYVPDNLNQIAKTVVDTVINNTKVVSIHFSRDFKFAQSFNSVAEANAKADSLSKINQQITFSTTYLSAAESASPAVATYNLKFVK